VTTCVPWYIWCSVLAVTSAMIGVRWDISWHRSIGRDTFWSPPHLAIYLCGVLVVFLLVISMEYLFRIYMHSAIFYRTVALAVPVVLAGVSGASGDRWAASKVVMVYTTVLLGLLWILPLFPAEPKLGPVYQKVTRFVPPEFPLLLIAPAAALDLLWRKTAGRWGAWLQSAVSGSVFLVTLVVVQWPFANFLLSPASRNRWFGTVYFDYNLPPTTYYYCNLFYPVDPTRTHFWLGMAAALAAAILTTRLGLAWGGWMRRVQR